jgi:hypothetical protein
LQSGSVLVVAVPHSVLNALGDTFTSARYIPDIGSGSRHSTLIPRRSRRASSTTAISYQILGVTPEGFTGISSSDDPDIWLPTMMAGGVRSNPKMLDARGSSSLYVFGRLKPGVSGATASTDIARIYDDLQRVNPSPNKPHGEAVAMARGGRSARKPTGRHLSSRIQVPTARPGRRPRRAGW